MSGRGAVALAGPRAGSPLSGRPSARNQIWPDAGALRASVQHRRSFLMLLNALQSLARCNFIRHVLPGALAPAGAADQPWPLATTLLRAGPPPRRTTFAPLLTPNSQINIPPLVPNRRTVTRLQRPLTRNRQTANDRGHTAQITLHPLTPPRIPPLYHTCESYRLRGRGGARKPKTTEVLQIHTEPAWGSNRSDVCGE